MGFFNNYFSAKDNKKYFKSLKGPKKLESALYIVDMFLNTKIYTKKLDIKTPHLIHSAEYILDRESKNFTSSLELSKTFNYVLTVTNNSSCNMEHIRKLYNFKMIRDKEYIKIGDYCVKFRESDTLFSDNPRDFFWLHENNQMYMVIPQNETTDNCLSVVLNKNIFNTKSVKIPLIHKNDINTAVLNGKDWVKHYILSDDEGYLYFIKARIKNQIFFKVGISKHLDRFKYKDVEIIDSKFIKMKMLQAALIEQYIHLSNSNRRLYMSSVDNSFEGKNECYHIDLIEFFNSINMKNCINTVCEYKNYNKDVLQYSIKN